ncbi:MAG TPA: TolC family protein [Verrucomicrobiae bacterium]|nr:TolC family protein [Verrucomicrobiae bacterium]
MSGKGIALALLALVASIAFHLSVYAADIPPPTEAVTPPPPIVAPPPVAPSAPFGPAPLVVPPGQTTGPVLTLDQAVANGLEYHPSIKQAFERIGAQAAVVRQQLAAYYPTINLNSQWSRSNQQGSSSVAARSNDFVQLSPTGTMTLYNFGKREGAVQSARETLDATRFNLKTTADTVVLGVKQAFYSYLQARALTRVAEETVRDRELIVRQARAFFEVGTRAKIDVARAESNLYNAQSGLISAQNGIRVSWVTLKNAMGLPDFPDNVVIPDLSPDQVQGFAVAIFPLSLDQARGQAFTIRPELKSFDAQLKAQDQVIATNRRGHLPDFILDANEAWRHVSNERGTKDQNLPIFPLRPSYNVRLSLNIPIFDGFRTTNRVEESVRTYYAIRAQADQQKQQVVLEVEQGYANLLSAQERIKSFKAAQDAAKENLDLANGRYQVGVGSIIEVTDAQQLYTSAEVDYVNSLYNYKVAEAQLLKAVGTP